MPADVFISHSTKDKVVAAQACSALEKHGVPCWIAPRNIMGGKSWTEEINTAITASTVVVLIFSAAALASPATEREIDLAADLDRVIIPMRIEPAPFTGGFRLTLAMAQWIDAVARPLHVALEDLAHTVEFHLTKPKAEAPAQMAAEPEPVPPPPPVDVADTLRKAHAAYLGGDRTTAQRLCADMLGAEPGNSDARILSGDIYAEQGQREEALAEYRRAQEAGAASRLLQEKM